MTLGCKDIEIGKSEFVTEISSIGQFHYFQS